MSTEELARAYLSAVRQEVDDLRVKIEPFLRDYERAKERLAAAERCLALEAPQQGPALVGPVDASSEREAPIAASGPTLVEAVPMVLQAHGPLKPAAIRERLNTVGFNQSYNDNYFYTVISRLSKVGAIVRLPDKRLSMPAPKDDAAQTSGSMH